MQDKQELIEDVQQLLGDLARLNPDQRRLVLASLKGMVLATEITEIEKTGQRGGRSCGKINSVGGGKGHGCRSSIPAHCFAAGETAFWHGCEDEKAVGVLH